MSAKASALAVEVKDFRSKNDQLQVEVDGLKGKLQRAEEELKVAKKGTPLAWACIGVRHSIHHCSSEHASQLEEVKKDVALKAQEVRRLLCDVKVSGLKTCVLVGCTAHTVRRGWQEGGAGSRRAAH